MFLLAFVTHKNKFVIFGSIVKSNLYIEKWLRFLTKYLKVSLSIEHNKNYILKRFDRRIWQFAA